MLDDGNLLVEFVVKSVSIRSPQNNYYTIMSIIHVQLCDAVDVLYDGVILIQMTWYMDGSITTICDDVMLLSVLYDGCCNE